MQFKLAASHLKGNAVLGAGALNRHVALAHVLDDFIHRAAARVAEAAAAGPFDSDGVVALEAVVAEARRETLGIF